MASIPSRFRGRARRDAAAFYLSHLARGILMGKLGVLTGHDTLTVQPTDFLVLEITVTQKARANHVSVRVRWPRRRGARPVGPCPTGPAPGGHLEFTPLSSQCNPRARGSYLDADHG